MMTTLIITIFIVGYVCIAFENLLKVNKAAFALLMCVGCWVLFSLGGFADHTELTHAIERNLGEASTTLFFLMGAMTIVEIIDQHGGFNFVRDTIKCQSKRKLLWRMAFMTAILSAVLDNLTTSIVMIMILRKLVDSREDRLIYAAMVIIAANSGGAFSPIGDVTTIMLWNGKMISALGVICEIIIPSFVSFIVPCFILQPERTPRGGTKILGRGDYGGGAKPPAHRLRCGRRRFVPRSRVPHSHESAALCRNTLCACHSLGYD